MQFTDADWVLLAGAADFDAEWNIAAARFWTTPSTIASDVHDPQPVEPESAARLLAAYPNPLLGRSMIRFALPHEAPVRLKIYDVAGRLVRSLVDEQLPAGEYTRAWNGADDEGRPVAAGVYFYRLEAGGSVQRKSVVVLREACRRSPNHTTVAQPGRAFRRARPKDSAFGAEEARGWPAGRQRVSTTRRVALPASQATLRK